MTYRTVEENIALVQSKTRSYRMWCECIADAMEHAGLDDVTADDLVQVGSIQDRCRDILLAKIYWRLVQKESQP